eukprot:scaffold1793_cov399-Prasinococcus_capsulatus_cf.AAC.4
MRVEQTDRAPLRPPRRVPLRPRGRSKRRASGAGVATPVRTQRPRPPPRWMAARRRHPMHGARAGDAAHGAGGRRPSASAHGDARHDAQLREEDAPAGCAA